MRARPPLHAIVTFALGATLFSSSASAGAQPPVVTAGPSVLAPNDISGPTSPIALMSGAGGAGGYMALWAGDSNFLAVSPFDATGAPIGQAMSFIADGFAASAATLAFDGTSFHAFWSNGATIGTAVIAPNGALLGSSATASNANVPRNVRVSGACAPSGACAAVWPSNGVIYGERFDAAGASIDASPIPLLPGSADAAVGAPSVVQIVPIASGYLVASMAAANSGGSQTEIQAFDPSLAALATAPTLTVTPGAPVLGGGDSAALLAWGNGNQIEGIRFDGSGAQLDAQPLSLGAGPSGASAAVGSVVALSSGFAIYVEGSPSAADAQIIEVDASGIGQRSATVGVPALGVGALSGGFAATDGSNVFLLANGSDGTYSALVGATGSLVAPATSFDPPIYEPQNDPDVAWDGTAFLAAWAGDLDVSPTIAMAAISTSGQVTALPGYPSPGLSPLGGPAIASNGMGYGFMTGYEARFAYSSDPSASPSEWSYVAVLPTSEASGGNIAAASDGRSYFGVLGYGAASGGGTIAGAIVDPQSGAATMLSFDSTSKYDVVEPSAVVWSGSTYVVAWVALASTPDGGTATTHDAYASFLDATGKQVAGPISVTGGGTDDVSEATAACFTASGSCVFAWTTSTGSAATRRFDAAGAGGTATPVAVPPGFRSPRLAWDGTEYVLAGAATAGGAASVVALSLDDTGVQGGASFTIVAPFALGSGEPLRVASDGAGHTAVAYARFQDGLAVAYVLSSTSDTFPDGGGLGDFADGGLADAGIGDGGLEDSGFVANDAGVAETGPADAEVADAPEDAAADAAAPDAGLDAGDDAGAAAPTGPMTSSGCGCTVVGAGSPVLPGGAFAMLVPLSLCATWRTRRRTRAAGRRARRLFRVASALDPSCGK